MLSSLVVGFLSVLFAQAQNNDDEDYERASGDYDSDQGSGDYPVNGESTLTVSYIQICTQIQL